MRASASFQTLESSDAPIASEILRLTTPGLVSPYIPKRNMAAGDVDSQVQSLIQSLQQPLASRIEVLESQAKSYERMYVVLYFYASEPSCAPLHGL